VPVTDLHHYVRG